MENVDDVEARAAGSFDELRKEVSQRTEEVRAAVSSFVDERPLTAVGIAFGVGYLLSGALVSRLTARLIAVGGRVVIGNALRSMVAGMGPGLVLGALGLSQQEGAQATGGTGGPRRAHTNPNRSQH